MPVALQQKRLLRFWAMANSQHPLIHATIVVARAARAARDRGAGVHALMRAGVQSTAGLLPKVVATHTRHRAMGSTMIDHSGLRS